VHKSQKLRSAGMLEYVRQALQHAAEVGG
jgi:hypothetical protein